ncbi:hypothetical protein ACVIHI_006219 [Bradyrhizobium sp. USDA 4524]|uniref:Uncharacterized protein n=1 Tax=Bradyrhizobium brasilense TaxID=1419277 RepID=A0A1G7Q5K9_9BRAD|nr:MULTISPECIES: hypothetical protein [Bradyrhizobium]KRQ12251.1 hypothetical protein AOQ73_04505 [Bradyrhizobium pachyrhizi]MCA6102210.1 hypothetical protein [Bradyrhizobium australafricanum]MCP1840864.1 hypothetical protein [Bradyrhizobium sp. USDA 4538]MCP1901427.1 hypothetical protein [Bradyrhizobium sp. USDA 4537]MCP1992917.1 hypothetical protein [Bradyrhizobium sp. USDA 4539]
MVGFPLLLVPLAVYNIIAFLMPGVSFTDPLIRLTLLSGEQWQITLSDMLLAAAVLLLLLEVIKGARPGAKYLTDHLLSLIVFGAAAAEFVLWPKFGNSTYGLLTLLALVDFISGIALRTRRRAVVAPAPSAGRAHPAAAEAPQPAPVAEPAPRPEPAPVAAPAPAAPPPAAPVPSATSVAESVLLDQSAPKPTVTSPDLQPGGHPPSDAPQR